MKVFVTGVGGQLGHDVINELARRGIDCVGSDISPEYSGIADGSSDPCRSRMSCYSRPEPHSLDDSVYFYPQRLLCISNHSFPETAKCGNPANTPS